MHSAGIMIVEDEGITAKDIELGLKRLGYHVNGTARTGEEAICKAIETKPDLILMDIRLPGRMDGIEAAAELRRHLDVPITFLTAFSDDQTIERASDTAPFGYLVKPLDPRELHATVQMALQRHRIQREVGERQERLGAILGAFGQGVIATDAEGRVLFLNPRAEEITGWGCAEATGCELSQVFLVEPNRRNVRPGDSPDRSFETMLRTRSGASIELEVDAGVARDADGAIRGFVWTFRPLDVERKQHALTRANEHHLQSVLANVHDVIAEVDGSGTIHYASPSVQRVLGYDCMEIIGRSALEWMLPEDVPGVIDALQAPAEGHLVQLRVRHRDGSLRLLEAAARRCSESSHLLINARDVSEREQLVRAVRDEIESAHKLVELGREMMAAVGTEDLLQRLCRSFVDILGGERCETWLQRPEDGTLMRVAEHGREATTALVPPAIAEGNRPWQISGADGVGDGVLQMNLTRTGDGIVVLRAFLGRHELDVAEAKLVDRIAELASQALEHARSVDAMAESRRLQTNVVAAMSHELRGSLNSMTGYVDLLLAGHFGELTTEERDVLRRVARRGWESVNILKAALDLTRPDRETHLDVEKIDVAELIGELVEDAVLVTQNRAVEIRAEVSDDLPALRTDPTKLHMVLSNLMSNAVKFTERGSITLRAREWAGGVAFSVADTGIGIAREQLDTIFQPFVQGHGNSRKLGGVGLGLYLVRELLQQLSGSIRVRSEVGSGTEFWVWLPPVPVEHRDLH